jgi:hypothetical protein
MQSSMPVMTHRLRDIRSDASGAGVHAFTTLLGCCGAECGVEERTWARVRSPRAVVA